MNKYRVVHYTAVTQNDGGDWVVLDNKLGNTIDLSDKSTPKDICKFLKSETILDSVDLRKVFISDLNSDIIEVKEKKGMKPICRLRRERF